MCERVGTMVALQSKTGVMIVLAMLQVLKICHVGEMKDM